MILLQDTQYTDVTNNNDFPNLVGKIISLRSKENSIFPVLLKKLDFLSERDAEMPANSFRDKLFFVIDYKLLVINNGKYYCVDYIENEPNKRILITCLFQNQIYFFNFSGIKSSSGSSYKKIFNSFFKVINND